MTYQPSRPIEPRQLDIFKGKRQRGTKPPRALEFATHCAIADMLRKFSVPGWVWTHFPAGEERSENSAARLKRMGMKPGWPDLLLVSPQGRWHCLELKRGPAPLNDAQQAFQAAMLASGTPYAVCRSYNEAIAQLTLWGALKGVRITA